MGFFGNLFKPKTAKADGETIFIDIPAELYYKELALYNATSLIGNAVAKSEIKCFVNNKAVKNKDYFLLNVSPNANETSSFFWHKVINKVIREGEALVVDANNKLYCADHYSIEQENEILGNTYSGVTVGNQSFSRIFKGSDVYLFKLNNIKVKALLDGMYEDYGKVFATAAKAFKISNGKRYIFHIDGVQAGDKKFNETFTNVLQKQLKTYIENENAVYPEFQGYKLEFDKSQNQKSADDFLKLRNEMFKIVASAFHIPDSMMIGNITNMKEIVDSFLTFGVDPFADMITEVLNKAVGADNFLKGNRYKVDTGKIKHRDIFDLAPGIEKMISCGAFAIDDVLEELGLPPLNTQWSKQHYITKNFEKIEDSLISAAKGGEQGE